MRNILAKYEISLRNKVFVMVAVLGLLVSSALVANNIAVTNGDLTGKNTTDHFALVQFDISWENSWRKYSTDPYNHDAAWVFIKYRVPAECGGDGLWHHANLNRDGHTAPTGSVIDVGLKNTGDSFDAIINPGMGVFIYRSDEANGTNNFTGVQLRWNYGVNYKTGTTPIADKDIVEVQVYAIEMAFVPTGDFFVGTNASSVFYETNSFTAANNVSGSTVRFSITSTPPTLQGNNGSSSDRNLSARGGGQWDLGISTTTAILATGFPTGYKAFYCMKYEISQQGYTDFLNSLPSGDATTRYPNQNTARHGITVSGGVYSTSLPYVACNWLSWDDVGSYLEWSALRPLTELEYEKACRGDRTFANEFAWGTINLVLGAYTLNNPGSSNETIASNYGVGNAAYYSTTNPNILGPVRVGIFAGTPGNTDRETAGATYYGIMEMSGNLRERTVTLGNSNGRAYTGTHGAGGPFSTFGSLVGFRGGSWRDVALDMRVSDRSFAATTDYDRQSWYGGRGARTAP